MVYQAVSGTAAEYDQARKAPVVRLFERPAGYRQPAEGAGPLHRGLLLRQRKAGHRTGRKPARDRGRAQVRPAKRPLSYRPAGPYRPALPQPADRPALSRGMPGDIGVFERLPAGHGKAGGIKGNRLDTGLEIW